MNKSFWVRLRRFLAVFVCVVGSAILLTWSDHLLWRVAWRGLHTLHVLRHIPQGFLSEIPAIKDGPWVLTGQLLTPAPHDTPGGNRAVLYYAWLVDEYGSGRSKTTRVLCRLGQDENLSFSQNGVTVPFELFHRGETIELLKHRSMESVPFAKVLIDLGPPTETALKPTDLPDVLRQRCHGAENPRGKLLYYEAWLPIANRLTTLGCVRDLRIRSCRSKTDIPTQETVRGYVTVNKPLVALKAYANDVLNSMRGVCFLCAVFLGFLCHLLLQYSRGEDDA